MAQTKRMVLGLLTFVAIGMIIGALVQLAFIWRLEDSYGTEPTLRGLRGIRHGAKPLEIGPSKLAYDKEAVMLRLGYVKPEVLSWSPRIILFHNFLSTEKHAEVVVFLEQHILFSPTHKRRFFFPEFLMISSCLLKLPIGSFFFAV
ncbi:unnamed protein product [Cuscuta epithymum]|uniref:Uncharacterized protein n=1 Tax=Cuscuta epithymum TaxID=186058 RepID=A0AAV0FLQ7_9ASTE|nr:unnamed protein product [Cuscuta epithymum]